MQSKKILFSIIIPHYNNPRLLKRCLQSLCDQSIKKSLFETIIIDDFSKTSVKNIFFLFKKKLEQINLISLKKNIGPGLARNIGIKSANGKYIIFLDCDDCLKRNTLSLLKKINNSKNYEIISYNYELHGKKKKTYMRNDGKILNVSKSKFIKLFLSMNYNNSAIFSALERKFLLKNDIFFKPGIHEDILFFFKIFFYSKSTYYINKNLYIKNNYYRSIINTFSEKHIKYYIESWCDIKKFILKKIKISFFDRYYLRYYAKGLTGITSLLIIKNNEFNRNNKKKRYLYYSIIFKKISNLYFLDITKSKIKFTTKYDQIFNFFVKTYKENMKQNDFSNLEKQISIIKNEHRYN